MTLTPLYVLLIGSAVTVLATGCFAAVVLASLRRQHAVLQAQAMELASLQGSLRQQAAFSAKIGAVLKRLLAASAALEGRMERLELRGGEPSYGRAIAVVQRGANADTLVRDFGLSKAEAELVSVVHARRAVG